MNKKKKIAFLFPGQGAQYPGMAKDFIQEFSAARLTFEEADDLLGRSISSLILNGPDIELTETINSQTAIFIVSIAILRVIKELYEIEPYVCAGLSLGEYSAITAAEWLPFREAISLVQSRAQFMNEACKHKEGTMAVIMGLEPAIVEKFVKEINLPNDLWVANYNCPGQVVISGTKKGIDAGCAAAKEHQAKRVLPLNVSGAFHSGLMKQAKDKLTPFIQKTPFVKGASRLVMNVPGNFVDSIEKLRHNLIEQVTDPVRWQQGIEEMEKESIDLYIEIGPGKTLAGMNRKIGVKAPTLSIEKVENLKDFHESNIN